MALKSYLAIVEFLVKEASTNIETKDKWNWIWYGKEQKNIRCPISPRPSEHGSRRKQVEQRELEGKAGGVQDFRSRVNINDHG